MGNKVVVKGGTSKELIPEGLLKSCLHSDLVVNKKTYV
jgi:hypothetical protein